jgi:ribosome-binding protein aMBF1 (putative translation factor)
MAEGCFNCGNSKEELFDAVFGKGIVRVCKECAVKEKMPIIRQKSEIVKRVIMEDDPQPKKRRLTVYERLMNISGVDLRARKVKRESLQKQEVTLKEIIDRNFKARVQEEAQPLEGLIDNFHWVIMRARRLKHLTQEQFAKELAEPKAAIETIEKGIFPGNDYNFVMKIEKYLNIKIMKKETFEKIKENTKEIGFDTITTQDLTIADLQEMKKKKERGIVENSDEGDLLQKEEPISEN